MKSLRCLRFHEVTKMSRCFMKSLRCQGFHEILEISPSGQIFGSLCNQSIIIIHHSLVFQRDSGNANYIDSIHTFP